MSLNEPTTNRQCRKNVNSHKAKVSMFAGKLNNSAAFCIEVGHYDRAIASLSKALKLISALQKRDTEDTTKKDGLFSFCSSCTIEGCISYSENMPYNLHSRSTRSLSRIAESTDRDKRRRLSPPSSSQPDCSLFERHPWRKEEWIEQSTLSSSSFSLYHRPIQVPPTSMLECHRMGPALSLLIVFNLALAHHLGAIPSTEDKRITMLQKALKFYELADSYYSSPKNRQCLLKITDQKQLSYASNRFEMIICNNASQAYRSINKDTKCQKCLDRLTSTLMLAVDHKLSTEQFQSPHEDRQERETDALNNCDSDGEHLTKPIDRLDGFFHTASQQILRRQCADAA